VERVLPLQVATLRPYVTTSCTGVLAVRPAPVGLSDKTSSPTVTAESGWWNGDPAVMELQGNSGDLGQFHSPPLSVPTIQWQLFALGIGSLAQRNRTTSIRNDVVRRVDSMAGGRGVRRWAPQAMEIAAKAKRATGGRDGWSVIPLSSSSTRASG